jgi:hypothetical protein
MPVLPPNPPDSSVSQQFEDLAVQSSTLTLELQNLTAYYQDTVDLSALAKKKKDPINLNNLAHNNFFPLEVVGDIVSINGDTSVTGLYLSKNLVTTSSFPTAQNPTLPAGTMISDPPIAMIGFRHDIFKILYPDPMGPAGTAMEIGSITAEGLSGQSPAPGQPSGVTGGDWAITGGTGAFLGVTGQMGGEQDPKLPKGTVTIRAASVQEDPSQRRINAAHDWSPNPPPYYPGVVGLCVIPRIPPQVIGVYHAARFILPHGPWQPMTLVTKSNPAYVGETLFLYATGLGPVRYPNGSGGWADVPIGQPFPESPYATVISPLAITLSNVYPGNATLTFTPKSAQGSPGYNNGYAMEFTVPNIPNLTGVLPLPMPIQISAAWIQGPVMSSPFWVR